jgi:hypothetical protein
MEFRGGRAHSAPSLCSLKVETSDSFEDYGEEEPDIPKSCLEFGGGCFKLVRFSPIKMCRPIPAVGRQVPTTGAMKIRAAERLHFTESVEVKGLHTPLLSLEVYDDCYGEGRHRRTPGLSPGPGTLVSGSEDARFMKCVTDSTRGPMLLSGLVHVDTFSRLAVDVLAYPGVAPDYVSALVSF